MRPPATYCYWSIATAPTHRELMRQCVVSARQAGETADFHVYCDEPIQGPQVFSHETAPFPVFHGMYKLLFLKQFVAHLNYDYFVFIDSDTHFMRQPAGLLDLLKFSPFHTPLETPLDQTPPGAIWEGSSLDAWQQRMRHKNTPNAPYYLADGGFWITHHDVIEQVADLALYYWNDADAPPDADRSLGLKNAAFTLSFITQMLCGNPLQHSIADTLPLWMPDRLGTFTPNQRALIYEWPLTKKRVECSPAMVHLKRKRQPV